jgi:enoyl-CoA hydratase
MDFGSFETLTIETSDGVATVTINRPESLNALSGRVVEDLAKLCEVLNNVGGSGLAEGAAGGPTDDAAWQVRGVILTGAGGKAFVAGADIREMIAMNQDEGEFYARSMHTVTLALEALPVPVIACVDGYALGGGCELALAADFIYASERAQFGQPEVNLGLVPGFGGSVRLQQRMGLGMARELIYTGRRIDAHEALRLGLVNRVLPTREELLAAAAETIGEIATKSPTAVALAKRAINDAAGRPTAEGLDVEARAFRLAFGTEDMREGTDAFISKRQPVFPGR